MQVVIALIKVTKKMHLRIALRQRFGLKLARMKVRFPTVARRLNVCSKKLSYMLFLNLCFSCLQEEKKNERNDGHLPRDAMIMCWILCSHRSEFRKCVVAKTFYIGFINMYCASGVNFLSYHCPLFREGCPGSSSRLSRHTSRSSITSIILLG